MVSITPPLRVPSVAVRSPDTDCRGRSILLRSKGNPDELHESCPDGETFDVHSRVISVEDRNHLLLVPAGFFSRRRVG